MIDDSSPLGVCQRPEYRPVNPGAPSLWDPQAEGERKSVNEKKHPTQLRHERARVLCLRCPLLEACEAYLCDLEDNRTQVGGVVAGRYYDGPPDFVCDLKPKSLDKWRQSKCRACGRLMWPRANLIRKPPVQPVPDECQHIGEGLCQDCYPQFARKARRAA